MSTDNQGVEELFGGDSVAETTEDAVEIQPQEMIQTDTVDSQQATKERMIPLPRFNEVLEENKRLKAEAAARSTHEDAVPSVPSVPAVNEVDQLEARQQELEDKAEELRMEGDLDALKEVRKEIKQIDRQLARIEARQEFQEVRQQETIATTTQQVIAQAEVDYPFLNPKNTEAFDTVAVNAVMSMANSYAAQGMKGPAALAQAVADLGPVFAAKHGTGKPAQSGLQEQVRQQRQEQARSVAADALNRQPAMMPQRGDKSMQQSIGKLTAAEVAKMPEDQKRDIFAG